MSRREKITQKVMSRIAKTDDGCWIWTGPTSGTNGRGRGYPRMNVDGGSHRHVHHRVRAYSTTQAARPYVPQPPVRATIPP